jgi:DNA-binding CsgD family transcriptional regulator
MEPDPFLPTLFASPVVGVAVLDPRMRFRAINGALAAMNGIPAARHVGRKLRHVLGGAAPKVECAMDQVFRTGKPGSFELTAELPRRQGIGHWMESIFPIRDARGRVTRVAAVVLEVTGKRDLENSLSPLVGNLVQIRVALKTGLQFPDRTIRSSEERSELFARSIELAEQCIATVSGLCKVPGLQGYPGQSPVPLNDNHDRNEVDPHRLSPREHRVLQLIADGKNNKEVGALLGISQRTVECYRARLMRKVEIHTLAHLVRFAVRNKIIEA